MLRAAYRARLALAWLLLKTGAGELSVIMSAAFGGPSG